MFGSPPGERLDRESRIASAAGTHHRSAQDSKIRRLVWEAPPANHSGLRSVSHARTTVIVRRYAGRSHRAAHHLNRSGGQIPLLHLALGKLDGAQLVFLGAVGDAAHRISQRVAYLRIEVEEIIFVRKTGCLEVASVPARGVL